MPDNEKKIYEDDDMTVFVNADSQVVKIISKRVPSVRVTVAIEDDGSMSVSSSGNTLMVVSDNNTVSVKSI